MKINRREFIKNPVCAAAGADAVMVSTPDHRHVPTAIDAARAGKRVSLEKPISTCIGHGRKLVVALKNHKVARRNDGEFRTIPEFERTVKPGKPTLEPLETARRTISMCRPGPISIETGSKLTWDPDAEETAGDNAASAVPTLPIRGKDFRF